MPSVCRRVPVERPLVPSGSEAYNKELLQITMSHVKNCCRHKGATLRREDCMA